MLFLHRLGGARLRHRLEHPAGKGNAKAISPSGSRPADRIDSSLARRPDGGDSYRLAGWTDVAGHLRLRDRADPAPRTRLRLQKRLAGTLAGAAGALLKASLPPAMADGQVAARPTLLPLPGELPLRSRPSSASIVSLGSARRTACCPSSARGGDPEPVNPSEIEARFFFNYLRGEFSRRPTNSNTSKQPSTPLTIASVSLLSAPRSSGHAARDPKHWP